MTALQVLKLDVTTIFGTVTTVIAIVSFAYMYRKQAKNTATMEDLKETENRLKEADADIVHRVERIEDQLRKDISEIKDSIKVIHNHILNCKK